MGRSDASRIRKACDEGRLTDALQLLCGPEPVGAAERLCRLADFFVRECCDKCAPCREGTRHIAELTKKFADGEGSWSDLEGIETLADHLQQNSLCHIGQSAGKAFESAWDLLSAALNSTIRRA